MCSYLRWPGEEVPEPLQGAVLGECRDLPLVLQGELFDEVYLCGLPRRRTRALQAAVGTLRDLRGALRAAGVQRSARTGPAGGEQGGGRWLPPLRHRSVKPGACGSLKRLLDIVGSAAALWVLFPFLLVVAALVKLTSRGPVFFRQVRVGLHGKKFHMLKFRSMVANAEELKATLASHRTSRAVRSSR